MFDRTTSYCGLSSEGRKLIRKRWPGVIEIPYSFTSATESFSKLMMGADAECDWWLIVGCSRQSDRLLVNNVKPSEELWSMISCIKQASLCKVAWLMECHDNLLHEQVSAINELCSRPSLFCCASCACYYERGRLYWCSEEFQDLSGVSRFACPAGFHVLFDWPSQQQNDQWWLGDDIVSQASL